jgi:phosphoglycolate phosphatase
MLRETRAVIFDLDGTLVDSLDDIMVHLNCALADHGLPPRSRDEVSAWVGYGSEQLIVRAAPHPEMVADLLSRFRAHYRARPVVHTRMYAGMADVLDAIAPGRKLAVLSNKPHDLTVSICDALLTRWPFAVVAGHRAGRPHKPDPTSLLDVVAELSIDPRECVLVGDSEVDVATGKAAGIPVVAVSWGMRTLAVIEAAGPDFLVHTPAELGALFR